MTAQSRLQFGTVALDPAPDCRVVRFQAALAEQFFDIAERERVLQVPAYGAKNQLGLGLSPLEDRRSDCLFHDRFRLPRTVGQSCNTTEPTPRAYAAWLFILSCSRTRQGHHTGTDAPPSVHAHSDFNSERTVVRRFTRRSTW